MFVFDRQHTFIGSLNLDPRSVTENTEIGSVIDSAVIGERVAEDFGSKTPDMAFTVSLDDKGKIRWDGFEAGKPVHYTREPQTSFFKRLRTQIVRMLPIESQI